jgi:hypothetical protein
MGFIPGVTVSPLQGSPALKIESQRKAAEQGKARSAVFSENRMPARGQEEAVDAAIAEASSKIHLFPH